MPEQGFSRSEIRIARKELGRLALEERNPYLARETYEKLRNKKGIKQASELALELDQLYDAAKGFLSLEDLEGLKRTMDRAVITKDLPWIEHIMDYKDLESKIFEGFHKFFDKKRIETGPAYPLLENLNAAYSLAPNYDYGIGIAKGGTFSEYLFNLFGLKVLTAETHRKKSGFIWYDSPEQLHGKKLIVFDKDAVTGKTLKRTLQQLKPFSPEFVDLYVNINISTRPCSIRTIPEAIPNGFRNSFDPSKISKDKLVEMFETLLKKFNLT